MIQPHNRHTSMSWYLAALAVVDTIVLAIGNFIIFPIIFGKNASDFTECDGILSMRTLTCHTLSIEKTPKIHCESEIPVITQLTGDCYG